MNRLLLWLTTFVGLTAAMFKQWTANTNFETASNWAGGRLPCANDRVRFPEDMGAVFVQTNTTITEMVLPQTGELILGNYVSISFPVTSSTEPGCPPGQEKTFNRTSTLSWFDPADWCVTSHADGDCSADQPTLLHSEQIPCRKDTTVFPPSRTFLVGLGYGTDIYTGGIILDGKSFTTGSFKTFIGSDEGRKQFRRGTGAPMTTITVTGEECSDKSGCPCGNDRGSIFEKICAASTGTCPEALCTHPIQAMGACCGVCGSVLKLDYDSNFEKVKLENLILSKYKHGQYKYKELRAIVSKLSIGQVQVVLTDDGLGDIASEVGELLQQNLDQDSKGKNIYGVTRVDLKESRNVQPTHAGQTGEPVSGGSIAGIIIGILIALLIIIIVYFLIIQKRRLNLPDFKATFQNLGKGRETTDLELGTTAYGKSVVFDDTLHGFDNPMYGDASAKQTDAPGIQAVSRDDFRPKPVGRAAVLDATCPDGFSNPLYGSGPIELPWQSVDFQPLGESRPATLDSSAISGRTLTYPDATQTGFSNPLYAQPVQELSHHNDDQNSAMATGQGAGAQPYTSMSNNGPSVMIMNPVFSLDADTDSTF